MSRIRAVYLADSTIDVRMLEGLAERLDLTLLAPAALGGRLSTAALPERLRGVRLLPGGVAAFNARAAGWLVRNRRDYEVVFVLDNLRAALAANAASVLTRRPVILQLGRPTEDYFRCKRAAGVIDGPRYALGLCAVKTLVAVNERAAAALGPISAFVESRTGGRARRSEVIPWYGVDTEAFSPRGTRAGARAALGLPEEGALVLFRSRLAPEKDPETFLRAMASLRAAGRDVTALYVGAEFREFEAMGLAAGVPVIGRGHVHPLTELPLYYRAASVTVQTSHSEGLGMSPLESLACGTPVVASRVGGLVEVARGGETALLAPPEDAAATGDAIAWVLDHPAEAAAMADRGRAVVLSTYATEHAFAAWERLAASLVAGSRGTPGRIPARAAGANRPRTNRARHSLETSERSTIR